MITPKSDFRPNPQRAVYINGEINLDLIHRLTPRILELQAESREPITVYIDSPGGRIDYMLALLRLLKAPTQDYGKPCHLITVVTRKAASAAADLLSAGDYAVAYPDSTILYHGGRLSDDRPLTAERLSLLSQVIRITNEGSAMGLAREIEFRFMFRFVTSQSQFAQIRQDKGAHLSDLDCFIEAISQHLTPAARDLKDAAQTRYARYNTLVEHVENKTRRLSPNRTPLEREAAQIKAIVDFEVRQNRPTPNWSFHSGDGLNRLTDDFLLFREYQELSTSPRFRTWCRRFGSMLMPQAEWAQIDALNEPLRTDTFLERLGPTLQPVWSFFVALCYALQRGENELTATDAYWLGLIDEIFGDEGLDTIREVFEDSPDPPQPQLAQPEQAALPAAQHEGQEENAQVAAAPAGDAGA